MTARELIFATVRRSLGVGPGGFGSAQWPIGPARYGGFRALFRLGWRALLVAMVLIAALSKRRGGRSASPLRRIFRPRWRLSCAATICRSGAHGDAPPRCAVGDAPLNPATAPTHDLAAVSHAFAAVADPALVGIGPDNPTTLSFTCPTSISMVVDACDIARISRW
jgi:hypothetical protein